MVVLIAPSNGLPRHAKTTNQQLVSKHKRIQKHNKQSELFFKLHELQTCSWGVSQIGRVAQVHTLTNANACTFTGAAYERKCMCIHASWVLQRAPKQSLGPDWIRTPFNPQMRPQNIDLQAGELLSEFDSILFGLTTVPIIGWFKLLPTFGGRVISIADGVRLLACLPSIHKHKWTDPPFFPPHRLTESPSHGANSTANTAAQGDGGGGRERAAPRL